MRKPLSRILLLFILMLAILGYYIVAVLNARADTPTIVESYYQSGRIKITVNELSKRQVDILLKVEDPAFFQHHGVDLKTPGAGWTTITQGLAKQFYFANFQPGIMKIKQTLCARFALDPLVPKETQLNLYINLMYFGNGIYGLKDAAQYYFGKNVPELTEDEYISLIACLISPAELNVKSHARENAERVRRIKKVLSGEYTPTGVFDITYDKADAI